MQTIFIHSGLHKTGTTAIQKYLKENIKEIEKENIYIPSTGQGFKKWVNHSLIIHSLFGIYDTPKGLVNILEKEISSRKENILLSSEDFSHLFSNKKILNFFCSNFEKNKYKIIFIIFFRNDLNYLSSLYTQLFNGFIDYPRSYLNFFFKNLFYEKYQIKSLGLTFLTTDDFEFLRKMNIDYYTINYNQNKKNIIKPLFEIIKKKYPLSIPNYYESDKNSYYFSKRFLLLNFIFFLKKKIKYYFNKH